VQLSVGYNMCIPLSGIAASSDNLPRAPHHGSYGDLSCSLGTASLVEGFIHEEFKELGLRELSHG
jgi:hypothetical protein